MGAAPRGAYGFRVVGLDPCDRLLVDVDPSWPTLEVSWKRDPSLPAQGDDSAASAVRFRGGDEAVLELGKLGFIEIGRDPATAAVRTHGVSAAAVVHPYLGAAASVVARWHGRESFHAGAFVAGGGAWVVLGARTAGKSSLLASLHSIGVPIVADDVVVVDDGTAALAAPRSLDLRRDSAATLRMGTNIGIVGARERWRVELAPVAPRVPIAGWLHLAWGSSFELTPVRGRERLSRLTPHMTTPDLPVSPARLLELASLPSLALVRPRDWGLAADTAAALIDELG